MSKSSSNESTSKANQRDTPPAGMPSEVNTTEFLRLFSVHQPQILAWIYSMLPDWNDAQDVLQETSIVLWKAFPEYQPNTNFQAWACKVAFHQILAFRKKQKRTPLPMGDQFLEAVASEVESLGHSLQDQLQALAGCIEKLRPRDADLLKRCYAPGANTKQVAADLQSPAGTVYKSLSRIRRRLYACIKRTLATEGGR